MRCLFLVKRQGLYGSHGYSTIGSGLRNSAKYTSDMLDAMPEFTSRLVLTTDNNDIDRECTKFKPDVVFIEAFWVVPEKFVVLHKLHPDIRWIVRNHSALPFMAGEGMAMDWMIRYPTFDGVEISCNDWRTNRDFEELTLSNSLYLPNYYPPKFNHREKEERHHQKRTDIDIGCFGAVRPLKNQLLQAVSAIRFANNNDLELHFHMNATRIEMGGSPILKNIQQLFDRFPQHTLHLYPWLDKKDFIPLLRTMDVHLQCSFSETFNVATADAVMNDVAVVTSPQISWVHPECQANPNSTNDIMFGIYHALRYPHLRKANAARLRDYDENSQEIWRNALLVNE